MIGFDKMSRYRPSAQKKAHAIMQEGIRLGYVREHDYGRGKGKYTTTDRADKMGLSNIISKIYSGTPIEKE